MPSPLFRSTSVFWTALAVALAVSACGSDEPQSTPASDGPCATTSTSGAPGVSLLPVTPAVITVVDAGAGSRAVLASKPNISAAQRVTLTTTSSEARSGGQTVQSVTMPLTARIGCTDNTNVELNLGDVTSTDSVLADELKAERNSRAGMSLGPGTMPISLRLAAPDAASSQARAAVEQSLVQALQYSVAFPTTPVGDGAKWTSVRTLTGAVTATQTITATLRSRVGNSVTLDVAVDETPINDVFAVPGTDQTLHISRYSMSGTGTVVTDLDRALPSSAQLDVKGARELVGNGEPLLQQMALTVRWATK